VREVGLLRADVRGRNTSNNLLVSPASINPFGILYRLALRSHRLRSRRATSQLLTPSMAYLVSIVTLESKHLATGDKTTLRHSSNSMAYRLIRVLVGELC